MAADHHHHCDEAPQFLPHYDLHLNYYKTDQQHQTNPQHVQCRMGLCAMRIINFLFCHSGLGGRESYGASPVHLGVFHSEKENFHWSAENK